MGVLLAKISEAYPWVFLACGALCILAALKALLNSKEEKRWAKVVIFPMFAVAMVFLYVNKENPDSRVSATTTAATRTQQLCKELADFVIADDKSDVLKVKRLELNTDTDNETVCHGVAVLRQGDDTVIRMRNYLDTDGEWMVKWDFDEAAAAQAAAVERQIEKDQADAEQAFNREYDRTLGQARAELIAASRR